MRADASPGLQTYLNAFWGGDSLPFLSVDKFGPDLALSLSHVYCAVTTISDDFGTMTVQTFEDLGEDGRRRVDYNEAGIGALARLLRWYPNGFQTAKAFWSTMAWQYLLRPAAYAEIYYRPGVPNLIDQIVPRNPDRVRQEVLPSGQIRFRLQEPNGQVRYISDVDMFCVRNTSADGLNSLGRFDYGTSTISSALALQDFTRNYFRKGATAALVATYKGASMEDEEEAALHASLTRYLSGAENAGGVLVVPEDIEVKAIGVDPEKAQLLGLKNISGRDVARMFKMPPSWLGIEGAQSYNSQVMDSQLYVNRCQMPMVVEFEQAVQRDLIAVLTKFFVKFNMDYLLRGDTLQRMQSYEIAIRSRVMRPNEARVKEDMSPDPELDKLSAGDFRPGQSAPATARAQVPLKAILAMHDNALRVLRRERGWVEKLAKKHAADVSGWQTALRDFYADHASYIAQVMRVSPATARAVAAQHGSEVEAGGLPVLEAEGWEQHEADELTALALSEDDGVEEWFAHRLVDARASASTHISVPVTIDRGAVQVDARTTVEGSSVSVQPPSLTIEPGAVSVQVLPAGAAARKTIQFTRDADGAQVGAVIEQQAVGTKVVTFTKDRGGEVTGATIEQD